MSEMNPNPFLYGRREYEKNKGFDIFVPSSNSLFDFFQWISGQQFLFEGRRGSGKTSILKSMNWSYAWKKNEKEKIKGSKEIEDYFDNEDLPKHFGVIYKCDVLDNEIWDDWANKYGVKTAQKIFAIYLEYSLLYLLLISLSDAFLEKPEILAEDWHQEGLITKEILSFVFPDANTRPTLQKDTFYDLSILFREKSGIIRSQICKEVPYDLIIGNLTFNDAGKIIQFLGEKITEVPSLKEVLIFPMIDDCDRLKIWQAKVVGSFIYRARNPISYKITSVMNLDNITDTTDNRPLTEHELTRLSISGTTETEWETNSSFYSQFNGILRTRISHTYGNEYAKQFDLEKLLGDPSLDDLVCKVIKESLSKDAIKFYQSFQAYEKENSIINYFMKLRGIIDEQDEVAINESITDKKLKQRKDHVYINKRRQVSAIAMFKTKELKSIKYPYAGLNVVLKLCCGSIRELLRIMYEIWNLSSCSIESFVEQECLSFEFQNKAIRKASESYWDSIVTQRAIINTDWDKNLTKAPPTSPEIICNRLGVLFSKLQSYPNIKRSNEIGSIKINIYSSEIEHILDYLTMAAVIIQNKRVGNSVQIALHPFFSPKFGLSPRHPFYYYKSLSDDDFEILLKGSDNAFIRKVLNKDEGQMSLI